MIGWQKVCVVENKYYLCAQLSFSVALMQPKSGKKFFENIWLKRMSKDMKHSEPDSKHTSL